MRLNQWLQLDQSMGSNLGYRLDQSMSHERDEIYCARWLKSELDWKARARRQEARANGTEPPR
jgi:hypothetical protein